MPRRKAPAPQRDQGKFEDRFLAGGADAAEEAAAGQPWDEWQAGGSDGESEEEARRPTKRRRKLQKRGRGAAAAAAAEADQGGLSVTVAPAAPGEQQWRFAELPVSWQAAAGSSRQQAAAEVLEEGQLLFVLQQQFCELDGSIIAGGSIAVHCQSSGGWQGSIVGPDAAAAEALLLLLRSGHLSCSRVGQPGAANGGSTRSVLVLSLTEKAVGDAAEHPEEQQQRLWHRQLLAVVQWLLPHLSPEAELEQLEQAQQAQHGGAADRSAELLSSPLCSPRKGERGTAAAWPGSPRSPGGGSAAGAAAAPAFDAAELYAAVKPSGQEPELPAGATSATLLPTLRRYQARAAQWMVQREQGSGTAGPSAAAAADAATVAPGQKRGSSGAVNKETAEDQQQGHAAAMLPLHPLWREVHCSNACSTGASGSSGGGVSRGGAGGAASSSCFYFNPYNGRVALERFAAEPEVRGGILSDEMGLGKTVELLACITAHPYTGPPPVFADPRAHKRRRRSRIECLCGASGAPEDEDDYAGLWLQCDSCDAWMHAACVGLKRAPPGEFVCGACQRAAAAAAVTQDCGATLVVCPTPIVHQWRDEILRHIRPGALKLVLYEGQPQPGAGRAAKVVTPTELAAADIVLTTYDVLRRDINHAPDGQGQGHHLRRRKKYEVMPTPLTRLRWWRVCLDEAQMVESSTAKAAEMALKLDTVHRWCVTGTPLSRGLEDLFGLLAFLQAAPYSNRFWWHRAVQQPYEAGSRAARARLLALLKPSLGGLLWRSAKADVAHELGLPPQHHHLTHLQLSAIERHFYRRQHKDCVDKAKAALSSSLLAAATAAAASQDGIEVVEPNGDAAAAAAAAAAEVGGSGGSGADSAGLKAAAASLATGAAGQRSQAAAAGATRAPVAFEDRALTRREEASLLHPLLRLRQACCHPQVGGGGIKAHTHARAPMTMGEVLEVMLAKARVEAEDAQRLLLASLNGLAGLLLLQGLPADAVRAYREALATTERNSAHIRADKLQQLHTLHNLADLLGPAGRGVPGVAPTLRDAQLAQQAHDLREEYLAESAARLAASAGEVSDVEQHAQRTKASLAQAAGSPTAAAELLDGWYMAAVALFGEHGREQHAQRAVAERIKEQLKEETMYLRSVSQNATTIASKFRDLYGLELALKQELRELTRAQGEAMEELQRLQSACVAPPASLVELAATCSRCRAETTVAGRVCRHCKLEELFWQWEGRAFALYSKAREGGGAVTAEEAIRQAQQAALNRVGRGGLGEAAADAGLMPGAGGGGLGEEEEGGHHLMLGAGRREDAAVATQIVRRPGDAENALRLLLHQLRLLRVPEAAAAEKELLLAAGKAHLELMEQGRRLYLKARALSLTQRARLYALDELEQCTMRIKLLSDNELRLKEGEEIYRIYEHEVPIRSTELSNDKAAAEAELNGKLGTLRYLESIKAREAARAAAAAAAEEAAAVDGAAAVEGADGVGPAGGAAQLTVSGGAGGEAGEGQHAGSPAAGKSAAGAAEGPGPSRAPGASAAAAAAAAGAAAAAAAAAAKPAGAAVEADICPVCHDELGQELVMLPCAHRVCCKCSMLLQERLPASLPQPSRRIACPTCRAPAKVSDLVYIDARLGSPHKAGGLGSSAAGGGEEEDAIVVKGSYGTKLEAVVRRLLWLTRRDATARVLVFSTWKDVLELISHALSANGLPHLYPRSSKKFEAAVAEFRSGHEAALAAAGQAGTSKAAAAGRGAGGSAAAAAGAAAEHPQVLLLLVKQGANGLNLTEAQHVVMAEPLLDPAVEAQAVGRVDRIGQTRSTHVHRFVVEHTIEENVHRLCQQRAAAMDLSAASIKRAGGSKEQGALTVRDVALLLRQPEEEGAGEEDEPPGGQQQQQQQPQQQAGEAVSPRARAAAAAELRAEAAAVRAFLMGELEAPSAGV